VTRFDPGQITAVLTGGHVVKVFEPGRATLDPGVTPGEYRPYVVVERTIAPESTVAPTEDGTTTGSSTGRTEQAMTPPSRFPSNPAGSPSSGRGRSTRRRANWWDFPPAEFTATWHYNVTNRRPVDRGTVPGSGRQNASEVGLAGRRWNRPFGVPVQASSMPENGNQYDPDPERVQDQAIERQHERTESVEETLGRVGLLDEKKYPVTAEELAVEYSDQEIDLPNETESLGSVFDRLVDERFESPDEAREAIYHAVTGAAAGPEEYNEQRAVDEIDDGRPE